MRCVSLAMSFWNFFEDDGARCVAGAEAGDAGLALEIVSDAVVGLLHPVGGNFDLQALLAGRDVFNGNIHGPSTLRGSGGEGKAGGWGSGSV